MTPRDESWIRSEAKRSLRTKLRAVRNALPPQAVTARSTPIVTRLLDASEVTQARVIALYSSINNEPDLSALAAHVLRNGTSVVYPRVHGPTQTLSLYRVTSPDQLVPGAFGVHEPSQECDEVDPAHVDCIVVPGLAFDLRGFRVGYGAGYYDRLLPRLIRAARFGAAYSFQLFDELPHELHDQPVHVIVTDEQVVRVN